MLGMWMILGFGNLTTMPLQIEYMTSSDYSIQATNTQIAIAAIVIPSITRIIATSIWGHLFDSFNFFLIRGLASCIQLAAILAFFFADSILGIYLGACGYGLALAGGNVNWSLWVTKFAPDGQCAAYMSVHGFLTGVRGVIAPFFGFYLLEVLTVRQTASFTAGLILFATALIWPISRMRRNR